LYSLFVRNGAWSFVLRFIVSEKTMRDIFGHKESGINRSGEITLRREFIVS
jgi:hypothetical protein